MWDTIKYASNVCDVILPNVRQQSSIKVYSSSNNQSLVSKIKYEVSKKILNKQKVELIKANESDLIYMWGSIPKNTDKKFIVELDNPYSLAYYHADNLHKNIEQIKQNLRKSERITYLSKTCMNHSLELFGKEFESKSFVMYPYIEENYKKNKRDASVINFIFVGLNSRGKGGDELLEAFHYIANKNIRLTFISNVSDNIKAKYKNDARISILPPQAREKLLNEIYPKMDVMIFPSFYESLGMVLLEALSYGMGIITMNTYATPEIVQDGYNGRLLHHPILKPSILNGKEVVNCVDLRIQEFYNRYLEHNEFYYGLFSEIKSSIEESSLNYTDWQKNSLQLFNDKFSPKIWQENFIKITSI
jgi:glycosyltransferase involved in cell wall biosynthesis